MNSPWHSGVQKKIHPSSYFARGVSKANISSPPQAVVIWLPITGKGIVRSVLTSHLPVCLEGLPGLAVGYAGGPTG